MARDQYLYRRNRKTKNSNDLLCNSAQVKGNILEYYRGLKRPGSDDYKCGRNKYTVNANHYTATKIGVDCRNDYDIYVVREKAERLNKYLLNVGSDRVIT